MKSICNVVMCYIGNGANEMHTLMHRISFQMKCISNGTGCILNQNRVYISDETRSHRQLNSPQFYWNDYDPNSAFKLIMRFVQKQKSFSNRLVLAHFSLSHTSNGNTYYKTYEKKRSFIAFARRQWVHSISI